MYRGVEVWFHVFLTSTLDGVESWDAPQALPPAKQPLAPIRQKVEWAPEPVWTRWRSEESMPGIKPRSSSPWPATILAEVSAAPPQSVCVQNTWQTPKTCYIGSVISARKHHTPSKGRGHGRRRGPSTSFLGSTERNKSASAVGAQCNSHRASEQPSSRPTVTTWRRAADLRLPETSLSPRSSNHITDDTQTIADRGCGLLLLPLKAFYGL
jgi:hypothetical protein